jgi:hypothetical protein
VDSLKKYRRINAEPTYLLYTGLRCGMVHSFMPDKTIKITQGQNDLEHYVIGIDELYVDLHDAWLNVCSTQKAFVEQPTALFVNNSTSGTTSN